MHRLVSPAWRTLPSRLRAVPAPVRGKRNDSPTICPPCTESNYTPLTVDSLLPVHKTLNRYHQHASPHVGSRASTAPLRRLRGFFIAHFASSITGRESPWCCWEWRVCFAGLLSVWFHLLSVRWCCRVSLRRVPRCRFQQAAIILTPRGRDSAILFIPPSNFVGNLKLE